MTITRSLQINGCTTGAIEKREGISLFTTNNSFLSQCELHAYQYPFNDFNMLESKLYNGD